MEEITISSGALHVAVAPLGARLQAVHLGVSDNLVVNAANEADALDAKKYNGATVGPVANRIAGGKADLDGETYSFEKNERGMTTLHSGTSGTHAQIWNVIARSDRSVTLELALADGTGGFPGNRRLRAEFKVDGIALHVTYTATTDAPTWINLALHPYWSLQQTRDALQLKVNAEAYVPVNDTQIPTGDVAPVAGTIFDHRDLRVAHPDIDHNYDLTAPAFDGPAVTLQSFDLRMEIETDAPGVQIYAGKEIGIAIEPQHWPDAMHHAGFPSVRLDPGQTYLQVSTYRFRAL